MLRTSNSTKWKRDRPWNRDLQCKEYVKANSCYLAHRTLLQNQTRIWTRTWRLPNILQQTYRSTARLWTQGIYIRPIQCWAQCETWCLPQSQCDHSVLKQTSSYGTSNPEPQYLVASLHMNELLAKKELTKQSVMWTQGLGHWMESW